MFPFHKKPRKVNLMILGASGGVANALLHHMMMFRNFFKTLYLVDKTNSVITDQYIDHQNLKYTFIQTEIKLPEKEDEYIALLKKYKINVVLDITDANTIDLITATNKAGVSYVNTAMNDDIKTVSELIFEVHSRKETMKNAAHILCTGMNPGNVNMWVRHGIEKFGIPKEVVHFELDTSKVAKQWQPMMTWSIHEFLVESIRDPSGYALGKEKIEKLLPNALENRRNMKSILSPIMKLKKYPEGMIVLHEENVSISYKYDIPSKFLYSVNPQTMENLIKIYEKKGDVTKKDLELGDNTKEVLDGADNIGVMLDYNDKMVYYFNTISNVATIGTNATYTQVIIGIFSALFSLLFDKIDHGIHFVEDLYDYHYKYFMFDNMRVQEFIFKKEGDKLKLEKYTPMIQLSRNKHFNHYYTI